MERLKKFLRLESQHLSKSILLEESGGAFITRLIVAFSLAVFVMFLAWSMITEVDEIAVAKGEIIPTGQIQPVQHISGGIVLDIFVEEGQIVQKGQPMLVLDNPEIRAQQKQLRAQERYLVAEKRRLESYIEEKGVIQFSETVPEDDPQSAQFRKDQDKILKLLVLYRDIRRAAFQNQVEQYKAKMEEIAENAKTLKELAKNNEDLALVRSELALVQEKLDLLTIRAPTTGAVHGFSAHSLGGILPPAAVIMEIVPIDRKLFAQVQISSKDIGHVQPGQSVKLKFTAYDYSRYGGMAGGVREISAGTFFDRTGQPYYKAVVDFEKTFLGGVPGANPILPGMTLDASIKTGSKTIFHYLLKPVYSSS